MASLSNNLRFEEVPDLIEKKNKVPDSVVEDGDAATRFEAVALPFAGALYNKALSLVRRPEEARDLVQETYLRAYRTFVSFREGTNCKAWLFTILYSIFINRYRKRQREPEMVSLDQSDGIFHQTLSTNDWEADFAALTDAGADWQEPEVRHALENLPESFRAAVLLIDVEGLTYEEAATAMHCPVGTLRSRLFRARRLLFVELHRYAQETGIIPRTDH
ncbi:MAG: sigma-70 family RNA polymerase sigma factor [Spartobacteria bacterium]